MPTTSNFGWTTPADTDLVKDGAAAIRTLGNGIDTSFVDLKGGTTNQILAKNSDTDLDFKWVSDATGMTNPMTTTGDVIYSSSGSTPARLGIGTAGQVLRVNSGATAPEWHTPATAGGMTLLDTKTLDNSVTNYTFTSIPGTYKELVIVGTSLQSASTGNDYLKVQFNADTSNNYYYGIHSKQNTSFYAEGNNTTDDIRTGFHFARTADANRYRGHIIMHFPDYAGSGYKQCSGLWGSGSGGVTWTGMFSGGWDNTNAITEIKLSSGDAVNLKAGTIKLYGVN